MHIELTSKDAEKPMEIVHGDDAMELFDLVDLNVHAKARVIDDAGTCVASFIAGGAEA